MVSFQLSVECLAATRRGARSNCGMRSSECGIGSVGELRNVDFGLRNGVQEKRLRFDRLPSISALRIEDTAGESRITGHGPRITHHELRKSSMAKRTHRVANARPQWSYDACCLARRRGRRRTLWVAWASTLETVRELQRIENPLDRPVAPTVPVMVANQELVREHRCGDLSRIVGQSAVPNALT